MRTPLFPWRSLSAWPGVREKALGCFPARGLTLRFLALDSGANLQLTSSCCKHLVFVCEGQGKVNSQPYQTHTTIQCAPAEPLQFQAETRTELFVIQLALLG